jgi:hypothetical protein
MEQVQRKIIIDAFNQLLAETKVLTFDILEKLADQVSESINDDYNQDYVLKDDLVRVWLDYALELYKQDNISNDSLIVIIELYGYTRFY